MAQYRTIVLECHADEDMPISAAHNLQQKTFVKT